MNLNTQIHSHYCAVSLYAQFFAFKLENIFYFLSKIVNLYILPFDKRAMSSHSYTNEPFIFFSCFFIFLSNFISNLPELKAQVRFSVNNLFCRPPVCKFYYFQLLSRTIHQFRPILTQNIQVC